MTEPGSSTPPPRAEAAEAGRRNGGGGCLPLLLFFAALWFWFGPWDAMRERTGELTSRAERQERRIDSLGAVLDSLGARRNPAPADSAAMGDSAGARR